MLAPWKRTPQIHRKGGRFACAVRLTGGREEQHGAVVLRALSPAATDSVRATAALAYADNMPAEPRHLRRALTSPQSPDEWERYRAARPGPGSVYSVFTPELRAVLERALELAAGQVETADLAAALDV